jgi:hypothetical protein
MKLSLIIDGNYLMQKSVFILHKLRTLYTDLPVILERDFNTLSNLYYFDNIYFISDSKRNWRKRYYEKYKGTRKKNEDIEWDSVYDIYNEFKNKIQKENKCITYQFDNLEGDDIISYIVKKSNRNGYSNLIIANDSDLFQLLDYSIHNKYINFMYNFKFNDETIFLPYLYENFIDSINNNDIDDLFESNNNNNVEFIDFMKNITINKKVKNINSEKELFVKIMGHNKDNIKSVYMKGNRGIGKVGAEKIYELYKETYSDTIDFNSYIFKNRLVDIIKLYKKVKNDNMDNDIKKRLNMNLKLVKLDKKSTPNELYEKMESDIIL